MGTAYLKWKELLIYEEEGKCLMFEAPMGVSPIDVYVPTAKAWNEKVPEWAQTKRDNILEMIKTVSGVGQVIEDESAWVETKSL